MDQQRDHHISGEQKEEETGKANEHEKALGEGVYEPGVTFQPKCTFSGEVPVEIYSKFQ